MSITNYIRDLLYNRASYKLEGNNINYLEEFRKFFEDNDNLLYPVKSLLLTHQYEKEIRKIKILVRELEAFKGLMMMIHDGSNLEENRTKRRDNILKGGSAEAGLILSPLGRATDDLSQRPAFEPSVVKERKRMLENIDKCQGDLFKLLEDIKILLKE